MSLRAAGDGTRVVLLGTAGGPGWSGGTERMGISSALAVGDRYYLVDAGDGAGRRLAQSGLGSPHPAGPLDRLRAVFITHLHSDHVADLNTLLLFGLFRGLQAPGREAAVQVWGPGDRGALPPAHTTPEPPVVAPGNATPGTRATVELLTRAYATDLNDRLRDNHRAPLDRTFTGHDVPIPPGYLADPDGDPEPRMRPVTFYEDDRVRVSATLVRHAPVFPALAFRFDTGDGAAVFSGDTAPSANLVELAAGAEVLVHEVMDRGWVEGMFPRPRDPGQEAVRQHLLGAHTTTGQVGPLAEEAGVATLALNHLLPAAGPDERWQPAGRGFSGRLVVGHDLDEIPVGRAG